MAFVSNFMERSKVSESFTRNKHQISILLDYHNLNIRLYNLNYKLNCLVTI
jgi:hypothetical protein